MDTKQEHCCADAKGRALCYEGAALLLEFDLNTESARAMFAEGCSSCPRNARLLREFACFEKRQGDLEVQQHPTNHPPIYSICYSMIVCALQGLICKRQRTKHLLRLQAI